MANISALNKLLAQGQDSALLRFGLASAYLKAQPTGYLTSVITHLTQCLALDPTYTAAYTALARAQIELAQQSDAKRTLELGIQQASLKKELQAKKVMMVLLKRLEKTEPSGL